MIEIVITQDGDEVDRIVVERRYPKTDGLRLRNGTMCRYKLTGKRGVGGCAMPYYPGGTAYLALHALNSYLVDMELGLKRYVRG